MCNDRDWRKRWACAVTLAALIACDESEHAATPHAATPDAAIENRERQLAVSADMMNRTLSIVDVERLREGGSRSDALVGTVDLSMYAAGPMSLNITPDGTTALVSISIGFLGLTAGLPSSGNDKLLFVDLPTRTVTGELDVGKGPMGIAITPDGKRGFVGLFGESYIADVDIAARSFVPIPTGESFNEEFAIDDTGEVALLTFGPAGNVRSFSVAEPATVFGRTTNLDADAAGVAFFPGSKTAYLMQAATPLTLYVGGHDLIDATDPAAPIARDHTRIASGAPLTYPVTAVPTRNSVAYPANRNGRLQVVEVELDGATAKDVQTIEVGEGGLLSYGIGATRDGRVLVTDPDKHHVAVVDLAAGSGFFVPWEGTQYGPTEIKIVP